MHSVVSERVSKRRAFVDGRNTEARWQVAKNKCGTEAILKRKKKIEHTEKYGYE